MHFVQDDAVAAVEATLAVCTPGCTADTIGYSPPVGRQRLCTAATHLNEGVKHYSEHLRTCRRAGQHAFIHQTRR